jgi:hypothetical protein
VWVSFVDVRCTGVFAMHEGNVGGVRGRGVENGPGLFPSFLVWSPMLCAWLGRVIQPSRW